MAPRTNRSHVDGGGGFVHDEDAGLPHEGPSQAEELPLALAKILPSFRDDGVWRQTREGQDWVNAACEYSGPVEEDVRTGSTHVAVSVCVQG